MAKSDLTPEQWASDLLSRLKINPTKGAVKAILGWETAEGGNWHNSARFNPLNTTQPAPGSSTFRSVGRGASDIRSYKSWDQGLEATVQTLRNGRYDGILAALKKGDANATASAIGNSPWGTSGDLIRRTVAAQKVKGVLTPDAAGQGSSGSGGANKPTTGGSNTVTTPGVSYSADRAGAVSQWLLNRDRPGALLGLANALNQIPEDVQPTTTNVSTGTTKTENAGADSHIKGGTAMDPSGKKVAKWIEPILEYARQHGWSGTVNSGYRSYAEQKSIYDSGVRPAAVPGTSNHEGDEYPRGAVDVSDAQQLSQILQRSKYKDKLQYAGAKDPVHFSHPHNGSY